MREGSRRTLARLAQLLILLVVGFFVYRSVTATLRGGWDALLAFDARALALSWVVLLVYYLSYVGGVAITLRALGARLTFLEVFTLSFVGNLGKYIPGGVWTVLGRVTLAPSFGLRRRDAAVSMVLENALSVLGGTLVFLVALPLGGMAPQGGFWPYLLPAAAVAACTHPAVLTRLLRLAFRLAKVEGEPPSLSLGVTVGIVLYFAATWLVAGVAFRLFAGALVGDPGAGLLAYAGMFAIGQVSGLLVLFAPGGIGVRESVLMALLTPVVGVGAAGLVGLSSRLWTTLLELLLSAVALVFARPRLRAGAAEAAEVPPESSQP